MTKGQKFLKVTSILMIIGGVLSGITCLLGIAGVALLAAVADSHAAALLLYAALGLALAASVAELIAGLKGLKTCKSGENADKCVVWGAVIAGITVVSTIINLVGGGKVNITSILLSLVVPGLYIYGAVQVKAGDQQPQQVGAGQPQQQAQPRQQFRNPYSKTELPNLSAKAQHPQQAPCASVPEQPGPLPEQQLRSEQAVPAYAFCPSCGAESGGGRFCQSCGADLQ